MFDFQKDYRFTWPVTALVPTLDGQVEKTFTGIFRLVPKKELEAAVAADPANSDTVVGRIALTGWKDDLVENKVPVPYSLEMHEELLAVPFVRYAIARAYYDASNGVLRLKN